MHNTYEYDMKIENNLMLNNNFINPESVYEQLCGGRGSIVLFYELH